MVAWIVVIVTLVLTMAVVSVLQPIVHAGVSAILGPIFDKNTFLGLAATAVFIAIVFLLAARASGRAPRDH